LSVNYLTLRSLLIQISPILSQGISVAIITKTTSFQEMVWSVMHMAVGNWK